jgi:hypothetical protein
MTTASPSIHAGTVSSVAAARHNLSGLVCQVMAAAGDNLRLVMPKPYLEAVTVEFDFRDPVVAGRRIPAASEKGVRYIRQRLRLRFLELAKQSFRGRIDTLDVLPTRLRYRTGHASPPEREGTRHDFGGENAAGR